MDKCPFVATKECEIPPCNSCVNFINCSFRDICSFDMHSGKELKKREVTDNAAEKESKDNGV